jgi:hypothetical protein
MPSHEIDTKELQETIQELHEEREERKHEAAQTGWTRYIGLSTAILAAVAAVSSWRAAYFINQALINQVKADNSWTQYQAARQKDHLFSLTLNRMLDENPTNTELLTRIKTFVPAKPASAESLKAGAPKAKPNFKPKSVSDRGAEYLAKVYEEMAKEELRSGKATELEKVSEEQIERHERFEHSVTLIEVAIALGAVAALVRAKQIWFVSLAAGVVGIALFVFGFMP